MTLLTIGQGIADDLVISRPSSFIGNNNNIDAIRILRAAHRAGKEMVRSPWKVLQKEGTITLATDTAFYALPSDYNRIANDTWWDRANLWRMDGPTSMQRWREFKEAITTAGLRRRFRIFAESNVIKMYIDPTPTAAEAGEVIVFDYFSNQWCQSSGGTGQTEWALDDDLLIVDDDIYDLALHWRVRHSYGHDYAEEKLEYIEARDHLLASEGGARRLSLLPAINTGMYPNIPETGYGS